MNRIRRYPGRVAVALVVAFIAVTAVVMTLKNRNDQNGTEAVSVAPSLSSASSGSASSGSASGSSGDVAGGAQPFAAPAQDRAGGQSADDAAKSAAAEPDTNALAGGTAGSQRIRTAQIAVQVTDVGQAAARIRATATQLGGSVASENSDSGVNGGPAQDVLVIRVPEPKLEQAVSAVSGTGKELSRTSTSEDVTGVLADQTSREASARASVARIRALMDRATKLSDVVLLEGELSQRESDLEAAEASHRATADQAAQATLTATLSTTATPAKPQPKDQSGFIKGLKRSWNTVLDSTTVLLTVLGALLPIAVLLLIVGAPAYLLARRNRRSLTRAATPKPVAAPEEKTPVAP